MAKLIKLKTTSDAAANYVLIVTLKMLFKKCYLGTSPHPGQPLHTNQERLSRSEMHSQLKTRAQTPTPAV